MNTAVQSHLNVLEVGTCSSGNVKTVRIFRDQKWLWWTCKKQREYFGDKSGIGKYVAQVG